MDLCLFEFSYLSNVVSITSIVLLSFLLASQVNCLLSMLYLLFFLLQTQIASEVTHQSRFSSHIGILYLQGDYQVVRAILGSRSHMRVAVENVGQQPLEHSLGLNYLLLAIERKYEQIIKEM